MTEFKVGDKIRCRQSFLRIKEGMTGVIAELKNTGNPPIGVIWDDFNDGHSHISGSENDNGYYIYKENIEIVSMGRKKKVVPVELHLILVDSCKNFVSVENNYKNAEETAKGQIESVTIYKLVEVAKVSSERRVKKIRAKKK
jgi:hypothetical protein